ncbi:TraR/DksA C4-type zinc finger protein [Rodentibacter trehalosifermentans]|uniref:Molecular chaperone DnaK n=1 Tax=Rodentibacter trehalosifermentans TaxID=1908263 RepID=A0A1V3IU68_9PAST|nr:TraR/DksA C4-type zinc finger protein [Rodentibacter trehalosifermentans]OOF45788.1 molecular chaperone DnaK [Rodentibacter trehalosifermentans]OOF47954.1 molecular chaperone DnaK [Rodentibacter trehalosifermentans]OOF53129.1 molecular chaperone DnaK [Rodentibacter trehalosifermentans]
MTDQFDRAQQIEEMQREIALKKHRTFKAVSRLYCEDCDAPIPEKRRQTIQGVTRCVICQEQEEKRQRHYR